MTAPAATRLVLVSRLTFLHTGASHEEPKQPDVCRFDGECVACGALLRPHAGDSCVFCSCGTVPCPPVLAGSSCCVD